jgi:hypothetical protein
MIRSERVTEIPLTVVEALAPYSAREFSQAGDWITKIMSTSDDIRVFYEDEKPLLVVGVIRTSLLGTPYLWFLLCDHFSPRYLRKARKWVHGAVRRYFGLQTQIEDEFETGVKFAEFFGFRKTALVTEILDRKYHVYEALP